MRTCTVLVCTTLKLREAVGVETGNIGERSSYIQCFDPFVESRFNTLSHETASTATTKVVLNALFAVTVFLSTVLAFAFLHPYAEGVVIGTDDVSA
jgi:hypothetical protein